MAYYTYRFNPRRRRTEDAIQHIYKLLDDHIDVPKYSNIRIERNVPGRGLEVSLITEPSDVTRTYDGPRPDPLLAISYFPHKKGVAKIHSRALSKSKIMAILAMRRR